MAIAHILKDYESIQSLALQYLGDATRWKEIADYNRLEYPYFVTDEADIKDFFGSGYVTIIRSTLNQTTVKQGWQFKTKPNAFVGGVVKVFEVTEDTVIPADVTTWQIPCRCTVPGGFGNITAYSISEAGDNTLAETDIVFVSIFNDQPFSGGQDLNIRVTGDIVYIPSDSSEVIPEDVSKMIELTGGSDLLLASDGDLSISSDGDLDIVSGANNIKYAVATRLATELGSLLLHPEYGTDIESIVGKPNLANNDKLIEIAVLRALANEDRITNVTVDLSEMQGTTVYVTVNYEIADSGISDKLNLSI